MDRAVRSHSISSVRKTRWRSCLEYLAEFERERERERERQRQRPPRARLSIYIEGVVDILPSIRR